MRYLWDTDTCIYYLNEHPRIRQKVQALGAEHICTTSITIAELKFGAYNSQRVEANLQRIEDWQQTFRVLGEINRQITTIFGQKKAFLKKNGLVIGDFDLLIASFALHHHMIIVTNNADHFNRIPDIRLENWVDEQR